MGMEVHASRLAKKLWTEDGEQDARFFTVEDSEQDAQFFTVEDRKVFADLTGYSLEDFLLLDETSPACPDPDGKNNLSKILLFNDPLLGIFDRVVQENPFLPEYFAQTAKKQRQAAQADPEGKNPYTVLLQTQAALCDLLAIKADFGVRLRSAYQAGDRETIAELAGPGTDELIRRLEVFYESFRTGWYQDWKSFGFEVHTIRIGSMFRRFTDVKKILQDYLEGRRTVIEELETQVLDPGLELESRDALRMEYNRYNPIATTSRVTW